MEKSIRMLLVVLPWVYWSGSYSPYEIPKTWVIMLSSVLSLFILVRKSRELVIEKKYLAGVIGGLWGVVFVSSILSGHFWQSFWGNYYRADGLLTLSAMIILGLAWKMRSEDLKLMGWVSLLTSVLVIVTRGGSGLYFGNQVFLAGYLAITLPLTLLVGNMVALIQLFAITLLGGWGAILAAIVMVIILLFSKKPKILILGILLVSALVIWAYHGEQLRRGITGETVGESRVRIWTKALIAIKERPLLGWGWAQYGEAFRVVKWPMHYDHDVHVDRSHASLTEYGVSGGVVAMGLYVWLMVATVRVLWNSRSDTRRTLGYVCLLYIIYSQTNITSVAIDWLFFASVGEAIRGQDE